MSSGTLGRKAALIDVAQVDENGVSYGTKHIQNKPRVSAMPYAWDIAEGNVPGHISMSKFGHNSSVGASAEEVWDGSAVYTYMTTASTLYISSDAAGDGQEYEVQGLGANWEAQTVNVTASGLTFVALPGTWIRVFRVKNLGTTDNAGNIYISDDNTDTNGGANGIPDTLTAIKAQISIGRNQTLMAIFPIPADNTGFLTSFYIGSSVSNKTTEASLSVRPFGGVFQIKKLIVLGVGTTYVSYDFPLKIDAKSDICISAAVSGGGGEVSAGFDLWYKVN